MFSLPGLLSVNQYVYRDSPVQELTVKIESGIFRRLYTTPEQAKFVLDLEDEVTEHISLDATLCVASLEPSIYVMSKAVIYAPQTWDSQFLYRGFTSAQPLLSYFDAMGNQLPSVIAATDRSCKDFYEEGRYEITSFIREHYHLYYEDTIEGVRLTLWQINEPAESADSGKQL